jgi:hypothetical protein
MIELCYSHQWDSEELKAAAADCNILPSTWIRPGGEAAFKILITMVEAYEG